MSQSHGVVVNKYMIMEDIIRLSLQTLLDSLATTGNHLGKLISLVIHTVNSNNNSFLAEVIFVLGGDIPDMAGQMEMIGESVILFLS